MHSTLNFMFYNTENFYDTVDDPLTLDDDFTPKGFREWTVERFKSKVNKLTKVIKDIVKPDLPDIIGLAEVENKTVMMSIIDNLRQHKLKQYSFIHYDSPDERGSDVALIYNTDTFTILNSSPILVQLPGIEDRTRDILYVKGKVKNEEIIHLFITHFPSRAEGRDRSERRRYFVASELRHEVFKILSEDPLQNILIMGDFNDTPDDNSIDEVLGAKKKFNKIETLKLYNLLYPRYKNGIGTTYHDGWLMYDQFIVSGNLLSSEKIDCKPEYADVFNPRYLLHFDKNNRPKPNRTYSGKYSDGFSDHLPIYLRIYLK
ncbi:MAG TPA: endonuclease/exonuclease/phosphatase family protein [Fermentimonas sp.]|nr:endonuclease/exonuclease/phosphatase family protein [Fermentimonas sp.]